MKRASNWGQAWVFFYDSLHHRASGYVLQSPSMKSITFLAFSLPLLYNQHRQRQRRYRRVRKTCLRNFQLLIYARLESRVFRECIDKQWDIFVLCLSRASERTNERSTKGKRSPKSHLNFPCLLLCRMSVNQ